MLAHIGHGVGLIVDTITRNPKLGNYKRRARQQPRIPTDQKPTPNRITETMVTTIILRGTAEMKNALRNQRRGNTRLTSIT
jgi:hypothetical protein